MIISDPREIEKFHRDPWPYRFRAQGIKADSIDEFMSLGLLGGAALLERGKIISRRGLFGAGLAAGASASLPAFATNRTAWTAGNGPGLTWTTAFATTDFTTSHSGSTALQTGDVVLSSTAGFTNGTNLDQFMDLDLRVSIASSTIASSSNFTFWLYYLLDDGSTYGDGQHTAGTADTKTPVIPPFGQIPFFAAASQTSLTGIIVGAVIRPGTFKNCMQNNCGFTVTSTTTVCDIETYNINLNN